MNELEEQAKQEAIFNNECGAILVSADLNGL